MSVLKRVILLSTILSANLPAQVLAQSYGQGAYDAATYAGKTLNIGPIGPIPITGTTIWGTMGAVVLSAAVGLIVWARQRRSLN